MRKANEAQKNEVRMLSRAAGAAYTGLGLNNFTKWAREIGAEKRFGIRRVLYDKRVIDRALDEAEE